MWAKDASVGISRRYSRRLSLIKFIIRILVLFLRFIILATALKVRDLYSIKWCSENMAHKPGTLALNGVISQIGQILFNGSSCANLLSLMTEIIVWHPFWLITFFNYNIQLCGKIYQRNYIPSSEFYSSYSLKHRFVVGPIWSLVGMHVSSSYLLSIKEANLWKFDVSFSLRPDLFKGRLFRLGIHHNLCFWLITSRMTIRI